MYKDVVADGQARYLKVLMCIAICDSCCGLSCFLQLTQLLDDVIMTVVLSAHKCQDYI